MTCGKCIDSYTTENKLEDSMKSRLKELVTMKTLFPEIAKIATISLTICISTASIKEAFHK